jgi:hypothetical protein
MDIKSITFHKRKDTIYGLKIDDNDLLIRLPSCKMPFGVEEYKNSYIVNLEWYDPNKKMKRIIKSFNKILKRFSKFMKKDFDIYESMTENNKNYKLRTKLKKYKTSLDIKVIHPEKTIFEVNSKEYLNPIILLDSIWIMNNRVGINIYLKEVAILNS